MIPVAPARGNRQEDWIQEGNLPQVLEDLGVFVVLNAVTNGLQTNPGSRLRGGDRTRRIEEDSVARPPEAATAGGRIHIVPTADGVTGGPSVGAIVKDAGRSLCPVQETRLNALIDRRIVHHPFWSVAEARVATGIAPEVASVTSERQSRPLLHGIQQYPMVDGTAPVAFIEQIWVRHVGGHDGLDAGVSGMSVGAHRFQGGVGAGAAVQFIGDVQVQQPLRQIGRSSVDLAGKPSRPERLRPELVTSEEALAATSYQPMTLLRIKACPNVVVVLPAAGGQRVQRESSEGCTGSPKFHTVSVTGTAALP